MTSILKVFAALRILFVFAMPFTVLAEAGGKPGPEKRSEVVALLKDEIQKLGLAIPAWLDRFLDPLLGIIVDVVVAILNRMGFFEHSEEPLPGSATSG